MIDEYLNEIDTIAKYVSKIRNKKKKEYALKYWKWLQKGEKGPEPEYDLTYMGAQAVRMNLMDLNESPIAAKGWTDKSISKFEKTIGKKADEKGFFSACVKRMEGKMGEQAQGFCAAVKDRKYNSTHWRGKDKTKKQAKKDVKMNPYKEKGGK